MMDELVAELRTENDVLKAKIKRLEKAEGERLDEMDKLWHSRENLKAALGHIRIICDSE